LQDLIAVDAKALESSTPASGYYATTGNAQQDNGGNLFNLDNRTVLKNDATWANNSALATGDGIAAGVEAATQNEIRYIVERMCISAGPAENSLDNTQKCLLGNIQEPGNSKGSRTMPQAGANLDGSQSAIYRITVRVSGPKNTQSFGQVYVY